MSATPQQLISFLILATVMSITPGPNNIMVLSSGMQFGVRHTMRHILGASIGSSAMLILVGLGLHNVFSSSPLLPQAMKYGGAAFIFYLSWKMIRNTGGIETTKASGPMSFGAAAMFQWINPKSWLMSSVAISTCLPADFSIMDLAIFTVLFALVSFPCVGIWAWSGAMIKLYFKDRRKVRIFNLSCAALLVASALSMTVM